MYLISNGGASCNIPDTVEAIFLTKNLDYVDGVKIDVRESLDHTFVLSKYDDLKFFTLSSKKVSESNYNYLKRVKFNSHVFKYYIPRLDEILERFLSKKIIVLMLYDISSLEELKTIIMKYSYKYYFAANNPSLINKLKEYGFDSYGEIIDEVIDSDSNEFVVNTTNNTLLISKYPEKIYKRSLFDKK